MVFGTRADISKTGVISSFTFGISSRMVLGTEKRQKHWGQLTSALVEHKEIKLKIPKFFATKHQKYIFLKSVQNALKP